MTMIFGPCRRPDAARHLRRAAARAAAAVLLAAAVGATALAAAGPGPAAAAVPQQQPLKVFGANETRYQGLKPFPKWTGALDRYFEEKARNKGDCTEKEFNRCHYQRWMTFLDELRHKDPMTVLRRINNYMNLHRYITDPINWGVADYWAAPLQFLNKDGDCEDYAIAKYLSLRALGWADDRMRLVVLYDLNLRVAHAVLLVRYRDKYLLLDNQIDAVVDASRIHHYRPIYSVNESSWWRYRPASIR